jgi:hypothetical protein
LGSGLCSREIDRLQLRGSGGFSPRFPNIPPANCFTLVQPLTNIFHGLSHRCALKNSPRIATLHDLNERRCVTEKAETEIQILWSDMNLFFASRSAERIVIDAPLESRFESM